MREREGNKLSSDVSHSPPSGKNKVTFTEATARFLSLTKFYSTCLSVAKIHGFKHFIISESLCCDEITLRNVNK